MTNCVNCGAPLHGSKCPYCGTEYAGDHIVADFEKDECTGTIKFGGKEYNVYLSGMEAHSLFTEDCGRTMDGSFHFTASRLIHKFTFIEL